MKSPYLEIIRQGRKSLSDGTVVDYEVVLRGPEIDGMIARAAHSKGKRCISGPVIAVAQNVYADDTWKGRKS